MASSTTTDQVLHALNALYHNPDANAKKTANEWLQEFQHSVDAWQICHQLLNGADSPMEARLFASQTFRTKILYDLKDIPQPQLFPLRDSLISALPQLAHPSAPSGSKAALIQICTALSDFGLQVEDWRNPVGDMIERFGKDPTTVKVLLEFLKSWIEEAMNPYVRLAANRERVSGAVEQVVGVLVLYLQAPGVTTQIQNLVFVTLSKWLISGDLMASQVAQTPLFQAAFDALASDELFDSAVDVLCDLIHETQEIHDNVDLIQQIIPRLVALRPSLEEHKEDADRIRGYCRLYSEAGECYKDLIVQHPADLLPLVEAVASCAAYPDLDIVPITFQFWYILATALGRQPTDPSVQPLLDLFEQLQTVIIRHLHFPADNETITPAERDEFRAFRHRMGDTLKDCCHVLGAATCLKRSYDMVVTALASGQHTWQEIEAPLFSMRSMGAEVDPDDDEVLPHIMDLLPKLPTHPRIRYAAILVISRYSQWIDRHPANIAFYLQYISEGFDMAEEEVSAAAAQAMKFMCQDCSSHLVPFLGQLQQFVSHVGGKLDQQDLVEVFEAIGYVISGMDSVQAASTLRQFVEPLLGKVQEVLQSPPEAQKNRIAGGVADSLEQLDSLLSVVRTLDPVPQECFTVVGPMFSLLDQVLAKHGRTYYISERVSSVLRRGLAFFPVAAIQPILQSLLARLVASFNETGYASFIWILGKTAAKFGDMSRDPAISDAVGQLLGGAFQEISEGLKRLVELKTAQAIPDVMDDYVHCFMAYLQHLPALTLSHPSLQTAFVLTLLALSCPSTQITLSSLDTIGLLAQRMSHSQYNPIIAPIFVHAGKELLITIIQGVVQDYPEDSWEQVYDIVSAVAIVGAPQDVEAWIGEAVQGVPGHVLPKSVRSDFMRDVHEHLAVPGSDRLRNGLTGLIRAARQARERGRQARKSLGA